MMTNTAVLAFQGNRGPSRARVVRTGPSGIGAALIRAGSALVGLGERIAARRAARSGPDTVLFERQAEFRRDAVARSHAGLPV